MESRCNIGVFDSGLGGVSVLKKLIGHLPHENIIYFGDTKNIPYGSKTREEIQALSKRIVDFLIKNNCKIIVIACNTATIATIDVLKNHCNIPIVGIIEAGIDVLVANKYRDVAIFGTRFTIESNAHLEKIEARDKSMKVAPIPCDDLCPMIEKGWETFSNRGRILDSYIQEIPKSSEALLLACTHYPFIERDIANRFSGVIIDPSEECAKAVVKTLEERKLLNKQKDNGKVEFYVTGDKKSFKSKAEKFLGAEIQHLYKANI